MDKQKRSNSPSEGGRKLFGSHAKVRKWRSDDSIADDQLRWGDTSGIRRNDNSGRVSRGFVGEREGVAHWVRSLGYPSLNLRPLSTPAPDPSATERDPGTPSVACSAW